jgi:hypothetical protein
MTRSTPHPAPQALPQPPIPAEDYTLLAALTRRYRAAFASGRMGSVWPISGGYLLAPRDSMRGQSHHLAEFVTSSEFARRVQIAEEESDLEQARR